MEFYQLFNAKIEALGDLSNLKTDQARFRDTLEAIGMERYLLASEMLGRIDFYVDALAKGSLMVLPTDTLYALSCRALGGEAALEKLYRLKGRSLERQIPIFVDSAQVEKVAQDIPEKARVLMEKIWPGPLTLVLKAKPHLPKIITGNTGSVGVRYPGHPLVRALLSQLKEPITGTSANLTGGPSPRTLRHIAPSILTGADYVVDGGELLGQKGSTVIDFTGPEISIIRQGDCSLDRIRAVIDL